MAGKKTPGRVVAPARPGRGPTLPSGLTGKQELFARLVAAGENLTEAYRQSYDATGMQDATVWRKAWELSRVGKVAAMIEAERARQQDTELHDAERARAWALERLKLEATRAETDGSRVRAIELVMRHHGLLTDRLAVQDVTERSAAEIRAALEARLLERIGVTITAEAEALDVDDDPADDHLGDELGDETDPD